MASQVGKCGGMQRRLFAYAAAFAAAGSLAVAGAVRAADGLPPGVPYAAPAGPMQIVSVEVQPPVLHGGAMARSRVVTSSNVAALTARSGRVQVHFQKTAPGIFEYSQRVPRIIMFGHSVRVTVTAIRTDGATLKQDITVGYSIW